jgi:phosphoglycolate phosphatase
MVGDSDTDVSTAKAAGIPVIGVTFGYTAIPVTDLECDAVISDYGDFDKALAGIIANRTT